MCFLLGLVVVLMQRVSDPRYIERGFKALGVPFDTDSADAAVDQLVQVTSTAPMQTASSPGSTSERPEDKVFASAVRDLVPRIVEDWTAADLDNFATEWFELRRNEQSLDANDIEESDSGPTRVADRLRERAQGTLNALRDSIGGEDAPTTEAKLWLGALQRFERDLEQVWIQLESGSAVAEASFASPLVVDTLEKNVDQRLIESMSDGTPWRRAEQVAFARLLEMESDSSEGTGSAALINTQQLEAESETLKGKPVRFQGSVQRIVMVENDSSYGEGRYWVLWLRGLDQALQPVALYTRDPFARELELEWSAEEKPEVEVLAVVGKRLAYASAGGVEVAPTLFANSLIRMESSEILPAGDAPMKQPTMDRLYWALGLGALAAFAVLFPIIGRWRKSPVTRSKSVFGSQFGERLRSKKPMIFWLLGTLSMSSPLSLSCGVANGQEQTPIWARENAVDQQRIQLLKERLDDGINATTREQIAGYCRDRSGDFPDGLLKLYDAWSKFGWKRIPNELALDLEASGLQLRHFELEGMVRFASRVELTDSQEAWYQSTAQDRIYVIGIQQDADPTTETTSGAAVLRSVFCRDLPSVWLRAARLKQPVQVSGVGVFEGPDAKIPICVLTGSVGWRLDAEDLQQELQPELPQHWLPLAEAGWDLAWIDRVANNSQRRLSSDEAEGLYSLIRLLKNEKTSFESEEVLLPMKALADSKSSFGKSVRWPVRLVSAAVVSVDDKGLAAALGANRYLQFDGFVDIGNQVVNYQAGEGRLRFEREFPVTVLTAYEEQWIPEELRGTNTLAWDVGRYYEAEGLYYRLWSYESELVQRQDADSRQASPLVLASKLSPIMPPSSGRTAGEIGWFGYALCLATLVILGSILYLATQRDRRRHR